MKKRRAFTTIEVLLASSLFVLITGVIFFALKQGTQVFNQVDGNFDALSQLRRASSWVPEDLRRANSATFDTKRVTTGGGGHGHAIWMLSSEDDNGVHIRDADGLPIYQKNVLYYLVRPNNHGSISDGVNCDVNDGAHPEGDPFCPHKVLIRTVIRKELNNETLRLDTGCLVAFSDGIDYDIGLAGGLKSMLFGGEGILLTTLKGTGSVWIQSLPFSRLAERVYTATVQAREEVRAGGK